MNREEKDMTGVMFVNDRKESDNHPDWKGRAVIGGRKVWVSAWKKEGQKGKYLSLSFQDRDEQNRSKPNNRERRPQDDSEIPW